MFQRTYVKETGLNDIIKLLLPFSSIQNLLVKNQVPFLSGTTQINYELLFFQLKIIQKVNIEKAVGTIPTIIPTTYPSNKRLHKTK